jgi:hypothetical protein
MNHPGCNKVSPLQFQRHIAVQSETMGSYNGIPAMVALLYDPRLGTSIIKAWGEQGVHADFARNAPNNSHHRRVLA